MDHSSRCQRATARVHAISFRPALRPGDLLVPWGISVRTSRSGRGCARSLEVRDAIAAGPAYLDEAGAEAGHSRFGEEALAYPQTLRDLSHREKRVGGGHRLVRTPSSSGIAVHEGVRQTPPGLTRRNAFCSEAIPACASASSDAPAHAWRNPPGFLPEPPSVGFVPEPAPAS